jgi:Beta-1,3-glucanase
MQNFQAKCHGHIPWKRHLLILVAFSLLLPKAGFSIDGVRVKFLNENSAYTSSNVYVAFCGQSDSASLVAKKLSDGTALQLGVSYSLADLKDGILLTKFIAGRICFKLGQKFDSVPNPGNANNPNFNNPSLPDFGFRWDKAEITYNVTDPNSVINLSATDFFGVRLRIRTYSGGFEVKSLTWKKPIATAFHHTGVLCDFSDKPPKLAVCIDNANGVPTQGPSGTIKVVRVIAPSTLPTDVTNPYRSFQNYINYVRENAIVTKIEGKFFGGPEPLPTYKFTAVVDSTGLLMKGTVTTNEVQQMHVIKIQTSNLDGGIYTANPLCNIDGEPKHPQNDPIGAAIRDVLAGFSYGFIGSNEINPNVPGKTFGETTSEQWHTPPVAIQYAFAGAQPNHPYYNQYAAALNPLTQAYGFPYSDFVQAPLAPLNPNSVDSMDITVLADQ